MNMVFADASYWIALVNPKDQWHEVASAARAELGRTRIVTTDEVLMEFLTALSAKNKGRLRIVAVQAVRAILDDPNTHVVPQTRTSFLDGLALYEQRTDKTYSLQDCISMNVMKKWTSRRFCPGITILNAKDLRF